MTREEDLHPEPPGSKGTGSGEKTTRSDRQAAGRRELRAAMKLAGLGMEFAGAILVFAGIGYLVDRSLGNPQPWGVVTGAIVGFGLGIYNMFRLVSKLNKKP